MQNHIRKIILFLSTAAAMAVLTGTAGCGRVPQRDTAERTEPASAVTQTGAAADVTQAETAAAAIETEAAIQAETAIETEAGTDSLPAGKTEEFLPMVFAKGRLYRLLREAEAPMGESGCVSGHIRSSVGPEETPAVEEQSNFGHEGRPYCLDEEHGWLDVQAEDKWMRFTAVDLTVKPADLDRMSHNLNLLGADGIELNYADQGQIVFHSFAGLFLCVKTGEGWKINRTLDLNSLGAGATQGDNFSLITADKDGAFISPECYSPKPEIPVTYRYLFNDNRLELKGRFGDKPDSVMQWSHSKEAMDIRETIRQKLGQEALWISNLYPVMDMDVNVYGFITLGDGGLETLGYGRYWKDTDRLEHEAIWCP